MIRRSAILVALFSPFAVMPAGAGEFDILVSPDLIPCVTTVPPVPIFSTTGALEWEDADAAADGEATAATARGNRLAAVGEGVEELDYIVRMHDARTAKLEPITTPSRRSLHC